jgi:importin-7
MLSSIIPLPPCISWKITPPVRNFFDKWFAAINGGNSTLPRVHDKKLSIVALCALLDMDPAGVPNNLQGGWHGIVDGVLKIFKDLPSAVESLL